MVQEEEIKEIIRECQRGNEVAFRKLVERYHQLAYTLALNILADPAGAEDVSQEAFVRVYETIARFDLTQDFYPWLYRIITNLCIDYRRKQRYTPRPLANEIIFSVPSGNPGPDEVIIQKEKIQRTRSLLQMVPIKYRMVLVLCDIEGLSSEQAARVLKLSPGAVRWRLHQARMLFKKIWEKETHDE